MVSKNKIKEVENVLSRLTLYVSTIEEGDTFELEMAVNPQYRALISKYASFKNDPELKKILPALEDKHQISLFMRERIAEYAAKRKKALNKKKQQKFVEREQERLDDLQESIAHLPIEKQIEILSQAVLAVQMAGQAYRGAQTQLDLTDEQTAAYLSRKPSDKMAVVASMTITRGVEGAREFVKKHISPDEQKDCLHYIDLVNIKGLKNGKQPVLVSVSNGRLILPHHPGQKVDSTASILPVVISEEGRTLCEEGAICYNNVQSCSDVFLKNMAHYNHVAKDMDEKARGNLPPHLKEQMALLGEGSGGKTPSNLLKQLDKIAQHVPDEKNNLAINSIKGYNR